ncbi:hypothetical protein FD755_002332, partial [Muntiacus reevesi]
FVRHSIRISGESMARDLDVQYGYGSNKKTQRLWPSDFQKFLVHNLKELEVLLMCNVFHNPKAFVERAALLAIRVCNPNARLRSKENEETATAQFCLC